MRIPRMTPLLFIATVLLLVSAACGDADATPTTPPAPTPTPGTPPGEEANFRFLINDEVNAIDQFESVEITISRIGVKPAGESDGWIEVPPQIPTVDLTKLQGENAEEIWSGILPDGQYTKVHIYVDNVAGVLKDQPDQTVEIKLPSKKIKISKGFEVATGTPVSFVYDVTVKRHGNERDLRYHLKVEIDQSGPDQQFTEVGATAGPKIKGELAFQLEGDVAPGGAATATLTYQGIPLPGVLVELDDDDDSGESLGSTDAQGQLAIQIPIDADEVKLETELEGKLKIEYAEGVPSTPEVSGELTLQLDGEAAPGGTATLSVAHQGTMLPDVPVKLNDEDIGVTDASGQLVIQIPADIQELELKAELEGEFKLKFREEQIETQEFEGTILSITEGAELNSPWMVNIPGFQEPVTVFVVEVEGTPSLEGQVQLKGVLLEGAIIDAEAEVKEPEAS